MIKTTTMTQKGQVTIPKAIRDALRVRKHSRFLVSMDKEAGVVILKPTMNLLDLAGSFKSAVRLTDEELNAARESTWGSRWLEKYGQSLDH